MDDYAGRVLADRYRLPLPPSDEYELTETRAFDTYSGQEVLLRQVPLPEVVEAEVLDADGLPDGFTPRDGGALRPSRTGYPARAAGGAASARGAGPATRRPADPAVRRAVEAAQAAARIPDHPRLDQVFDVFAEGGSLWIASELVAARPLAALLAEQPLTPYRAAEVASDILMALRVLHGHGWVHRNITARTVLVCDDGRVMLTGLAVGAAEEALCGYDPVPPQDDEDAGVEDHGGAGGAGAAGASQGGAPGAYGPGSGPAGRSTGAGGHGGPGAGAGYGGDAGGAGGSGAPRGGPAGRSAGPGGYGGPGPGSGYGGDAGGAGGSGAPQGGPAGRSAGAGGHGGPGPRAGYGGDAGGAGGAGGVTGPGASRGGPGGGPVDPEAARRAAIEARAAGALPPAAEDTANGAGELVRCTPETGGDIRAARAGAIAAYRAGARAAARVQEAQQGARTALPGARPPAEDENRSTAPPGRIADPYGVRATPWNGTAMPPGAGDPPSPGEEDWQRQAQSPGQGRTALPAGASEDAPDARDPWDARDAGDTQTGRGLPPARVPAPGENRAPGDRLAPAQSPTPAQYPTPAQSPPPSHAPTPDDHPAPDHPAPGLPAPGLPAPGLPAPGLPGPGAPAAVPPAARWDDPVGPAAPRRGPATALAAERARQARMTVVGPVTERWAPEQAGPVHENWQLAAPIGPATDLWALGALLFRAVQGHAPYPEDSTAELVQLVCSEPPAFAEECGALRPVVESLLRQDPTERLDVEELGGWLRSLVRSAPEPEAGAHVVAAPPADPARLPVIRRRGELVRRRRAGLPVHHGRHKRARGQDGSPRSLGRLLLLLVLLLLAGAVAYAMLFMPKADDADGGGAPTGDRTGSAGQASPAPSRGGTDDAPAPTATGGATGSAGSTEPQTTGSGAADGFAVRKDAAGFQVAVPDGWTRTPKNGQGQVTYAKGDFELIVVPGRDGAAEFGSDPMAYQREREGELQAYRASSWATSSGLRTIQVGGRTMAEGQFTWNDASGRELFVRNVAILLDGRYHVLQVRGPETQRDKVDQVYEQASASYRYTG
ncbi:protein kinase [Streptomyces sp. NPDC085995]|uniref:protein kinase n=1 Tax=Streptomyces sp. NPDC085995 TaxID=3154861 RepID=UPI003447C855